MSDLLWLVVENLDFIQILIYFIQMSHIFSPSLINKVNLKTYQK